MFFSKKYEAELVDLKNKTQELSASLNSISKYCATIIFSNDGNVLEASELFLNAVGYTKTELVGQHS